MTNDIKRTAYIFIYILAAFISCNAQIYCDKNYLLFGDAPMESSQRINIRKYSGLYFGNEDCFLKIDMTGKRPAFSGSNDRVVFYDKTHKTYCLAMCQGYYMRTPDPTTWDGFTHFEPEDDTPNLISRLNPVEYNWKAAPNEDKEIGLLAQEIEELFPELVVTDENGTKLVDYLSLLPLIVQAIKDLNEIIEEQSETLINLTNK